ncbi:MAG TPA: thiamine-phosphate kinase, partial [Gammaproteobacteria bacterium]
MSEFDLINHYFKAIDNRRPDVALGIGDDCAVLQVPDGHELAVSTDTLVAGVHFPLTTSAEDIGYKALAVNLSDLAAMGAEPAWMMLSLTMPNENADWLSGFVKGFRQLMDQYHLQLVGGDTTRGPLSITVQVFGFLPKGKALRRDAAKPGNLIYVSGTLGDAGLGLKKILNEIQSDHTLQYCIERLNRPTPRITLGKALLSLSRCAIDISDGLLADLGHIVEESSCAAIIHIHQLPLSDELKN